MALDAYSPCPCGSGLKFKWCCQPIHEPIARAMSQEEAGQHDAALRTLDEVMAAHPDNPEVYGRQAQLLYQNGKAEEAEAALEKALSLNPKYPFGYLLRGLFRQNEGELAGALLLFRKAAEYYDPQIRDVLAQVYSFIADCELKLNRPVAAHAALEISNRLIPNPDLQQGMEEIYGAQSHLPASARVRYRFLAQNPNASDERKAAWEKALQGASGGKLTEAAQAFESLTATDPQDAAAWFNLGLARAWLGDNARAVEALDRFVEVEPDPTRAAAAWALAEVLRFGQGMEDQADYVNHTALFQIRSPQHVVQFLQQWERGRRLIGVQVDQEQGVVSGLVLDAGKAVLAGTGSVQPLQLGGYFLMAGDLITLRNINLEALDRVRAEMQQALPGSLSEAQVRRGPANFGDVFSDSMVFPIGAASEAEAQQKMVEHVQKYFEEEWIHRPLRSLRGTPPVDAAGHAALRKKLRGVVQFLEECGAGLSRAYDFDRLRRKLGLVDGGPVTAPAGSAGPDLGAMGAPELAAVPPGSLTDDQLEQAYRAAVKLDAQDLAENFARNLVQRPVPADRPDRFPVYTFLIQRALQGGDASTALDLVNEGEKADCEKNEGRRRNDYELRRGQVLVKRGDFTEARDTFQRLIDRAPAEMKYRGTATESLLSAKQGAAALHFAEQGLAKAREKNDRDSEQYFLELTTAARKLAG